MKFVNSNPNTDNNNDKVIKQVNIRVSWLRFVIVIAAMISILVANIIINYRNEYKNQVSEYFSDHLISLRAVENRSQTINKLDKLYSYYDEEYAKIYGKAVRSYIDKYGLGKSSLRIADTIDSDAKLFMAKSLDSDYFFSSDGERLQLNSDQLSAAKENALEDNDYVYDTITCNDGVVIARWAKDNVSITSGREIIDICEDNAFVYNTRLNEITYADSKNLIQPNSNFIIEKIAQDVPEHPDDVQIGKLYVTPEETYLGYGVAKQVDDENILCTYFSEEEIKSKVITLILFQSILKSIFVIFFVICLYFFIKHSFKIKDESNFINIGKDYFISKIFLSRIFSVFLVGALLFSVFTYYVNNLVYFSQQNISATDDLLFLQKNIENNEQDRNNLTDKFEKMMVNYANCVSVFLEGSDDVGETTALNNIKNMLSLEEISVYDYKGVITDTTTNYSGYTISNNDETNEYRLWNILNGGSLSECYPDDSNEYIQFAAVRRIDTPGIVKIGVANSGIQNVLSAIDLKQSLIDSDFNSTAKVYIDSNEPEILYWVNSDSNKIKTQNNPFVDTNVMNNGYAGAKKVFGGLYYINSLKTDNYVLMSCENINNVKSREIKDTLSDIGIMLLIMIAFILSTVIEKGDVYEIENESCQDERYQSEDGDNVKHLQTIFKISLNMLLLICMVCLITFLAVTNMTGNNSFISYIFMGSWDKGYNIFSITVIIMTLFVSVFTIVIEKKIIQLLCNNLGTQSATAGYLISSILKVFIIGFAIFYSLLQIGLDTSTLLASIGIGGLVLGMGAKDLISDLIAGIFIVFEGHVCVGEWVTVGDFHGLVTDIGIRTTKITNVGGKIKSISNSDMKNVVNYSRSLSWIGIQVYLNKDADLDFLKKLISDNEKRLCKHNRAILKKPEYSYIEDITRDGIQVVIATYCEEKDVPGCSRQFREAVFELLRENNLIQDGVSVKVLTDESRSK